MIRPYRPRADNAEIVRLIRAELVPFSHTAKTQGAGSDRELASRLKKGAVFVASGRRSSPPLGFIHLLTGGDTLIIDMLAVHPRERGKRIGTELMRRGEQYGMSRKCRGVRLYVDDGNDRAHRFYARLGYETVGYDRGFRCYELFKTLPSK